ncbi:TPA: YadA family autotransporter adhesin [Pseudomonas aeruginosa]|nr:YadA-like family protein [Pseudomonas aeruginosa]
MKKKLLYLTVTILGSTSFSTCTFADGNITQGNSKVIGNYNTTYGDGNSLNGNSNVVVGSDNKQQSSSSNKSLSFGNQNKYENNSISIGNRVTSNIHGMAIGNDSSADSASSAIGAKANSSGYYSIAIGNNAQTSALEASKPISIGNKEITQDENGNISVQRKEGDVSGSYGALALGASSSSHNTYSTAVGGFSTATGKNSTAIGHGTLANGESSVALGDEAISKASNSIAIGSNSISERDNTVSVGSAENTRQITNVAAGKEKNDAVNVTQLHEELNREKTAREQVSANTLREIQRNSTDITKNRDTIAIHNGEISNLNKESANSAKKIEDLKHSQRDIEQGRRGIIQTNSLQSTATPTASGNNSLAAGSGSVASKEDSVAIGNNAAATARNSIAIGTNSATDRENTLSVGSTGSERTISNVAPGTHQTDAVNLSQMNEAITNIQSEVLQGHRKLNKYISKVDKNSRAGIAGVTALTSIPQVISPGQAAIGVGVGNYRGESAIGIGLSKATDSGNLIFKGGFSIDTQSRSSLGAGISYILN